MAIRVRNLEELAEKIDDNFQWRKKEISDMLLLCRENNFQPFLCRAALAMCCAHFEGGLKYASNAYVAYISAQHIRGKDLRIEILSIPVRKQKHSLFGISNDDKLRITTVADVLMTYDGFLEDLFSMDVKEDDPPIPTAGNPKRIVREDIVRILGLNYDELFGVRDAFIDGELLKNRHRIVHGERHPVTKETLEGIVEFVRDFLENYKAKVISAAQSDRHLRNPERENAPTTAQ